MKNHSLGFEVPYLLRHAKSPIPPGFLVLVDDGYGPDDPLHLWSKSKATAAKTLKIRSPQSKLTGCPESTTRAGSAVGPFRNSRLSTKFEAEFKQRVEGLFQEMIAAVCFGTHIDQGIKRKAWLKHRKHPKSKKDILALDHKEASRRNIPTAEYQSVMRAEEMSPVRVTYPRRNRDLDPQLVWRGKDEQDWSDLVVACAAAVHPGEGQTAGADRRSASGIPAKNRKAHQMDLYADFNGFPEGADKTPVDQHEGRWQNRMILGDSLQVMASLAEREGLRGKVQCIYLDPPYGIKFNSNFQWSTTSRDVKDGNVDHITREPEQVKAFRDTWRDGVHSYLTYLRDRLAVARDLLSESGSIFVQIGDENVHRVRALMDEVFEEEEPHIANNLRQNERL